MSAAHTVSRTRVLIAFGLGIIALILALTVFASLRSRGTPTARTTHPGAPLRSLQGTGIVIAVNKTRTEMIARDRHGQVAQVAVKSGSHVVSSDGRALNRSTVQVGDHLTTRPNDRIEDLSQHTANVHGLVSIAPISPTDSLVIVVHSSSSLVVDLATASRYSDASHETASPVEIEDGDVVQVHGMLDEQLGEMTRTDTIMRIGPTLKPTSRPGTSKT